MKKALFSALLALLFVACSSPKETKEVTVYVSEDQVFSQPVLEAFEKETGIQVRAVYDTEESKSTGVMNRLIAEKNNPRADVYWANEPIRAEVLRQKGILAPYQSPNAKGIAAVFVQKEHFWTGFSARIRLLIVSNKAKNRPDSILNYLNADFKAKGVIANPLFGTTTSHIAALFTIWGEEKTKDFLTKMKQNRVSISTSNGESADFVADGTYDFALVDSDDAMSKMAQKASVSLVYPDQKEGALGAFVVPNVVMLIKGSTHPENAKKLIDFLLGAKSEEMLAFADCAQIPLHEGVAMPTGLKSMDEIKVMQVDYAKVAKKLLEIQPFLKAWVAQ